MNGLENFRALTIGLEGTTQQALARVIPADTIVDHPYDLEKLMELQMNPPPSVICCGPPPEGVSLVELAQVLRMQFQEASIYFITSIRTNFDRTNFKKNGFTDAFIMPFDVSTLDASLKEDLSKASKGLLKVYRPVKLVDIAPGATMEFSTYLFLPANKKHVKFSAAGDSLDTSQVQRLAKHQVSSMRVSLDEMPQFYKFTAGQLKNLKNSTGISETEKQVRMQTAVREIMSGIFADSGEGASVGRGKQVIADCQEIVKAYITDGVSKNAWFEKLLSVSGGESNAYSHQANVATFASLFSMGLGIGKPEELAISGLLHDVGVAKVPAEIQGKPYDSMTAEEKAVYEHYPEFSVDIMKERKLVVAENVMKFVLNHRERFDGSGFPKKRSNKQVSHEAQILGLACMVDEMTCAKEGKATVSLLEAVHTVYRQSKNSPERSPFDPDLLAALIKLFPAEKDKAS